MKISIRYTIKDWIEDLQKRGRLTFTLHEVFSQFPSQNPLAIKRTLTRLAAKGKIVSAWKGFYVIIPLQYHTMGILPAIIYIDSLMAYLQRNYYVSLLNAAVFHGASHQSPQEFTVICTPPSLRSSIKKGVKINFIVKKEIKTGLLVTKNTPAGTVEISSAELTAADLVQYEHVTGGLSRVSTVLNELAEVLDFTHLPNLFFEYVPMSVVQRLGYLLDVELGHSQLAGSLMQKIKLTGIPLQKTALKKLHSTDNSCYNTRWKVLVNARIETDD